MLIAFNENFDHKVLHVDVDVQIPRNVVRIGIVVFLPTYTGILRILSDSVL